MPSRKASGSVVSSGRGGLPPSSPMVSSANNPNKSEIPDRRKDSVVNTVRRGAGGLSLLPQHGPSFGGQAGGQGHSPRAWGERHSFPARTRGLSLDAGGCGMGPERAPAGFGAPPGSSCARHSWSQAKTGSQPGLPKSRTYFSGHTSCVQAKADPVQRGAWIR